MVYQETGSRLVSCTELLNFSEDSLGKPIADFLEGRERPQWIFEQGLKEARRSRLYLSVGVTNYLQAGGVIRVSDLLSKTRADLLGVKGIGEYRVDRIDEEVARFFSWLRITPEMRLLGTVFGFWPEERGFSLSAEGESKLKENSKDVLALIGKKKAEVLTLRFGLKDWRARSLEEVAGHYDLTRERIRRIEAEALRGLRLYYGKDLQRHLPNSLKETGLYPYAS